MEVRDDSVEHGFKHLETIAALHFHKPAEDQMEAMTTVMGSFGMDEEAITELIDQLAEFVPKRLWHARGWMLMGFVAGLSAAQNAIDND